MTDDEQPEFDEVFDVVVIGSGAGGLVGALTAATNGLRTLVAESTDKFGGTTSYSGGGLWLPGNAIEMAAGVDDSPEQGRAYLRAVVGPESIPLQDAFIDAAVPMVEALSEHPVLEFEYRPFPDYFDDAPHFKPRGRDIFPAAITRADVGDLFDSIRFPLPVDRRGEPAPDTLVGGVALIARLLLANRATGNTTLRLECEANELLTDDGGAVVGVVLATPEGTRRVGARRGVLIAAGGFERNQELRERHGVPGAAAWSMGAPGGTGAMLEAAIAIGADTDLLDQAWLSAGALHPDGTSSLTPAIYGGIFVDAQGRRFANESLPYDRIGRELAGGDPHGAQRLPCWFVFDDRFGDGIPVLSNPPPVTRSEYELAGLWRSASTLTELAESIDVPAGELVATVERFNAFAAAGRDQDFTRGEHPYDVFFAKGDGPNPALVPIDRGPFHAVTVVVSDLGTKGGVVTDVDARVLRSDGSVIPGLYATGNSMASMTRRTYPGPGMPIGTSMVFAFVAARHIVGAVCPAQ